MTSHSFDFSKTAVAWSALQETVYLPRTEAQYNQLVALMDNLVDEVGEDENHPLASLMEIVSVLIENYETEHVPEITNT
jgi:HTH-type transcriptional regulator / antitoxin HigA